MITWFLPKGQVWKRTWIKRSCLKMDVENYIFLVWNSGQVFEEPGGTPHQEFPGVLLLPSPPPPSPAELKQLSSCDNSTYSIISVCSSVLPFKLFCCVFVNLTRYQSGGIIWRFLIALENADKIPFSVNASKTALVVFVPWIDAHFPFWTHLAFISSV